MEQEIEDIKKLKEVLQEEQYHYDLEDVDDPLNFNISNDEQLDGYESDSSVDLDNITVDNLREAEVKYLAIDRVNFTKNLGALKHHLSSEEARVINSCKDEKLKRLLLLNRATTLHLKGILHKLYESLNEVTKRTVELQTETSLKLKPKKVLSQNAFRKVGYPYFKVKDRFSCRPNADAIAKKQIGMIPFEYCRRRRWTVNDQVSLKRSISFQYKEHRIKEIDKEMRELNRSKLELENKHEALKRCETILKSLKDDDEMVVPPLNCDFKIDWEVISVRDLRCRHSVASCEGMWNMYLHPSISKSTWSECCIEKLTDLAKQHNYQNWDLIASELNKITGQNFTAFTTYIQFCTTTVELHFKGAFSPEEDEQLLRMVNKYRMHNYIPWARVAMHFDKRSRSQLYNRYHFYLRYGYQKKGAFSDEEDVLLIVLVKKFGLNFNAVSQYFPCRSTVQLSHRYNNYLNRELLHCGGWSVYDDEKILRHVEKHGPKNWSLLVQEMPARNNAHVRHRYSHIQGWLAANNGKDLQDMPRQPEQKPTQNLDYVRKISDMFNMKGEVPTLAEVKEIMKQNRHKTHKRGRKAKAYYVNKTVDNELLHYFQSCHKLRTARQISNLEIKKICQTMKLVFGIFNVTLIVPPKDELANISGLDHLDLEILSSLFGSAYKRHSELKQSLHDNAKIKMEFKLPNKSSLLPPNLNTLVGMRGLLLKYNTFKLTLTKAVGVCNYSETKKIFNESFNISMNAYTELEKETIMKEHNMFVTRLRYLFKWPSIMSLVQPKKAAVSNNRSIPTLVKRKRGRPKKNILKVELMNVARLLKKKGSEETKDENLSQSSTSSNVECFSISEIHNEPEEGIAEVKQPKIKRSRIEYGSIDKELSEDIEKLDKLLASEMKRDFDVE